MYLRCTRTIDNRGKLWLANSLQKAFGKIYFGKINLFSSELTVVLENLSLDIFM